jgi:RHS repeat-associated protein
MNTSKRYIIRVLLVLMFSQVFSSALLKSQSCYVDYTDPSGLDFLAAGGSELVYIYTYPTNCVPDITCPSWVSWTMYGWGEIMFYCSQNNTGQPRADIIYVGEEGLWIGVSQEGGLVGGSISGDQAICYNTDPSYITNSSDAVGGTQPYTYQWEESTDGGYYWSTLGVSTLAYDPSSLTEPTKYRRKVTDASNTTAYSNIVTKTVWTEVDGGSISGTQTINYNTDASPMNNNSSASGGTGSFTYQWQKSEYNGSSWGSWSNVSGATSVSYDPPALTVTTKYRRVATNTGGCGTGNSNEITKTVCMSLSGGAISEDRTIVYNEEGSLITSDTAASGGSGSLTYQWKKSMFDGSAWSEWATVSGATSETYTPPALTVTTRYRRDVTDNNGCGTEYSNIVTLEILGLVYPDKTKNFIAVFEPHTSTQDTGKVLTTKISRVGIKYFDGLGKPLQDIAVSHNGDIDLITPHIYDQYGRDSVSYLPVPISGNSGQFVADIISQHESYYYNTFADDKGYSKKVFENSPLNRVLKQGAPGTPWQPSETGNDHSAKFDYQANSQNEVLFWKIVNNNCENTGGEVLSGRSYYPVGTLYKNVIKDENWDSQGDQRLHTTEEFKNTLGQVVLKRSYVNNGSSPDVLNTYYVYDDLGLLRYVLPPKASSSLGTETVFGRTHNLIKGLCYYYQYDGRKRMVEKQLPGADPVYMVYDKRDRLVLVQDGNLRQENNRKWLFTKYDMLNRPVLTGILTHSTISSRTSMQEEVDDIYDNASRKAYTERDNTYTQHLGYEDESFPNSTDGDVFYYTATYYDDYNFPDSTSFEVSNNISDYEEPITGIKYNVSVKSLVTGSKTRVLGTSTFITTTSYYDDNYRPIQTLSNLFVGSNGREVTSTKYDFIGNPLQVRQKHIFQGSGSTMTDTYYAYDNYGRLLTTEHQIDEGTKYALSENTYNETGQLEVKGLHKQGTDFLQDIDYDYNIRGWLTAINNPNNLDDDLFSMRLYYNDISALSPLTSQAQYNGNISGVYWNRQTNGSTDTLKSSYSYIYDELNRISNNYYGEDTGSGLIALPKFREYDYSYDLNGNILALKRTGSAGTAIDNLAYDYGQTPGYSNNLVKVTDSSQSASGFKDGTNQSEDYEYDKNGNLKKDLNKGITTITYNFLNLPELITMTGGSIRYYYDATGRKVSKVVTEVADTTVRSYEGGFEYENGLLSIIHTDEGFVENTTTGFVYNYYLKDHLGNTRAVFSPGTGGTLTLNQSTDYYPFGLDHAPGYGAGYSKYKYNGKEIQDDLIGGIALDWYDYGARFYDPQIGRWHVPDPLAELFFNQNPYHYVSNNPLLFIDPTGMAQVETPYGMAEGKLIYWDGYGSDEGEKGEKEKDQDGNPPKKKESNANQVGQNEVPQGQGSSGWLDNLQTGLDVAGIADPTGLVDLGNALIYAIRGQWGNAGISTLAIIPYIGDVGKVGRLGSKALKVLPPSGFKHVKQFGYPHGQKVYEYNGKYFSRDIDSHNGGVWKVFEEVNGKLKRIGTADERLKIFKD